MLCVPGSKLCAELWSPRALHQALQCIVDYVKTCKVNMGTLARCHTVEFFGPNNLLREPSAGGHCRVSLRH